jgi:hypothetical protein
VTFNSRGLSAKRQGDIPIFSGLIANRVSHFICESRVASDDRDARRARQRHLEDNLGALQVEIMPEDVRHIGEVRPKGAASASFYPAAVMDLVNRRESQRKDCDKAPRSCYCRDAIGRIDFRVVEFLYSKSARI